MNIGKLILIIILTATFTFLFLTAIYLESNKTYTEKKTNCYDRHGNLILNTHCIEKVYENEIWRIVIEALAIINIATLFFLWIGEVFS